MTPYKLTEDELRQEQGKVLRGSGAAAVICAAMYGLAYLFLPRMLHFPDDVDSALTFWAGASLFIVLWIMVGIGLVSRGRRLSAQDIRGSAYGQPSPRCMRPSCRTRWSKPRSRSSCCWPSFCC
jgi:hypothetical protein